MTYYLTGVQGNNDSKTRFGRSYQISGMLTIPANSSRETRFVTNDLCVVLTSFSVETNGADLRIRLYENPTSATGGSEIIPRNLNRIYADDSSVQWFGGEIAFQGGLLIDDFEIYGAEGIGNRSGGGDETNISLEWVYKKNTQYVRQYTNNTDESIKVSISSQWYECTSLPNVRLY